MPQDYPRPLLERVQAAIGHSYPDDARAAIREVAAWLRKDDPFSYDINSASAALEREAAKPTSQED
jgi:hypothetical protein